MSREVPLRTEGAVPVFPREIAPETFWFSTCLEINVHGTVLHSHNSCYLVVGNRATVLVDTAAPFGWRQIHAQLVETLAGRPLDFIFATHPESPHMGNAGPLLAAYPAARIVGDLRNYQLYLPGLEDRFMPMNEGDVLDLGDRHLVMVPAVVHDLPNTLWGYETRDHILFVSDGYPYTHDHKAHECAMTSEELPQRPRPEDTSHVIEGALNWTRYVDADLVIRDLDALLDRFPTDVIAPAHGAAVTNPREIIEVFKAGLKRVSGARRD